MGKGKDLLIIGANEYKMATEDDKLHSIAQWVHSHYSHTVKDVEVISTVKKMANGASVYEDGNKIYILPQ
jgi:hypothetical protein